MAKMFGVFVQAANSPNIFCGYTVAPPGGAEPPPLRNRAHILALILILQQTLRWVIRMCSRTCRWHVHEPVAHWRIPLFFRTGSLPNSVYTAPLRKNAGESLHLRCVRRTQLHSVSAVCESAAKTAYPLRPSSFSKSDPLRRAPIWVRHLLCKD